MTSIERVCVSATQGMTFVLLPRVRAFLCDGVFHCSHPPVLRPSSEREGNDFVFPLFTWFSFLPSRTLPTSFIAYRPSAAGTYNTPRVCILCFCFCLVSSDDVPASFPSESFVAALTPPPSYFVPDRTHLRPTARLTDIATCSLSYPSPVGHSLLAYRRPRRQRERHTCMHRSVSRTAGRTDVRCRAEMRCTNFDATNHAAGRYVHTQTSMQGLRLSFLSQRR